MKNQVIIGVLVAVIFAGGGFYAGVTYAAAKSPAARFAQGANGFTSGNFAARTGGSGRIANNSVLGTILSKSANGVTVQLGGPSASSTNGTLTGTRMILINSSTQVNKTTSGSISDLSVGTAITANGSPNSDGSLTATSVQIRPSAQTR